MKRGRLLIAGIACAVAASLAWAHAAHSAPDASGSGGGAAAPHAAVPHQVTAVKSWASPTASRITIEFSGVVAHVSPDSGSARTVIVTVPEPAGRAPSVPEILRVGDGLVDSVLTIADKNGTLAVARALVDQLNQIPGVKGVLTRSGDYFIPLYDRYHMAEKMKADFFISIHANSTKKKGSGSGTEVYFLSLSGASAQADRDLADAENAADLVGGVPAQTGDELVNILYDVKRSSVLQQSQLLAETVLDNVAADRRLESRGVKQAGFVVLKSVEFPSILVETAFINNPAEARLLKNPEFQKQMGKQLAIGVRTYFQRAGIG